MTVKEEIIHKAKERLHIIKRKQELFIMENGFESTTYKILIEFYQGGSDKK